MVSSLVETAPRARSFSVANLLTTQNPFYLISAVLVLWGIWSSILPELRIEQVVTLWGITAGYTLLVTLTTIVVIRIARDWEDARTLLLIVPLLGSALSMIFDEFLLQSPLPAMLLLGISFVWSVFCVELLLAWTKIPLTIDIRAIYYLLQATFHAYPAILFGLRDDQGSSMPVVWGLTVYPFVIAVEFLLLVPTMPRAKKHDRISGMPYPFPLYPYSLFGLLLVVAAFRLYLLSLAFAPGWNYVLLVPANFIPFVFVAGTLFIELMRVSEWKSAQTWGLLTGPAVLLMAGQSHAGRIGQEVLALSSTLCGWLVVLFHAYAATRKVRFADYALIASLIMVGLRSSDTLVGRVPHSLSLVLAVVLLFILSWQKRQGIAIAGASVLTATITAFWLKIETALGYEILIGNLSCLILLGLQPWAKGGWLDFWRDAALFGLFFPFMFLFVSGTTAQAELPWLSPMTYGAGLSVGYAAYGWWFSHRLAWTLAAFTGCIAVAVSLFAGLRRLQGTFLARGLIALVIGFLSLAIGLGVTFWKPNRNANV